MPDGAIYQAARSFSAGGRIVRAGETIREGHPLLVAYPQFFKPFEVVYEVEQATAAPGEKRATKRTKTSSKKG
jgi:hypothetical protein